MSAAAVWLAVQTHAFAEAKAAEHFARQGYGVFLPRFLKKRRHARRVETVAAPLFPRYLFVELDRASQPWRPIQSTVGVAGLVRAGDEPAIVPTHVIAELLRRAVARGFIVLPTPVAFVTGDRVRVVDGIFGDCFGLFEGTADTRRFA